MNRPLISWLKLMAVLVVLPLSIVLYGIFYMATLQKTIKIRAFETEAAEMLESIRYVAATEQYLCNRFAEIYDSSNDEATIKAGVEQFAASHDLELQFLVNKPDGSIYYSNFNHQALKGDLTAALVAMKKIRDGVYSGGERNVPADVYANLRAVYGPHFFPRYAERCYLGKSLALRRGYASPEKPLVWLKFGERFGLTVFFQPSALESACGVKFLASQKKGSLIPGYIKGSILNCSDNAVFTILQNKIELLQLNLGSIIQLNGYYLLTNFIDSKLTAFCAVKADEIDGFAISETMAIVSLLLFGGLLTVAWLSFQVIVKGASLSIRIRRQLLVLFIASNALPGFVLWVIGSDYLQQYRAGLLNNIYIRSMAYLQNIDELYSNELTVQKKRIETSLSELSRKLKRGKMDRRTILGFLRNQKPAPYGFYLVASSSGFVASDRGILKNEKIHESFRTKFKEDTTRINTMNAMFKIGTFVLSSLNKQPITGKAGMEAELVSESITQRSPIELIRMFADRGTFSEWGIGGKRHPIYVNLLQLFNNSLYDYLLLYLWTSDDLEFEFISRIFHNLNRNELGLRIMAVKEDFVRGFPEEVLTNKRLMEFALKLRDRAVTRPEACVIDGVNYLLVGHKCVSMSFIRLLGLYPLQKIDTDVEEKARLLWLLALVSLLVSVSLGLFVAGGILRPLGELQAGVGALNKRNFAHRLPDLGGDEFGHLARIFNETLIDLEELHVASQVQEKLMTRMTEPLQTGCLNYFCRTATAVDNGGEYFDLITTSNAKTAIIFGKVPESGVGNSLILAFVKSAVMQLHCLTANPAAFMIALNALLIRSSRENQRKCMLLQYLILHEDGLVEIVNAGMPSPLLIDRQTQIAQLLEIPGASLGSSLNAVFGLSSIRLAQHQGLAFSTMEILPDEITDLNDKPEHSILMINASEHYWHDC